jgi:PatG C-terminal
MNSNSEDVTIYTPVYALGRVEARFPTLSIEKELAQATGRSDTTGLTDRQALYEVLKGQRYLVRQLCWVLTIEGMETYILRPRDPTHYDLLVEALRQNPSPMDVDLVIGMRGAMALPQMCNGLVLPIVAIDQLYSFDRDSLLKAIPRPDQIPEDQFRATAGELLDRIMQMSDNAGATDEDRALNYLAVRYPAIYARAAESHQANASLTAVEVRPSALSGTRNIVEVIFSFKNRSTDVVEKFFVRVDVTEEFPFLVTKLSAYFDR